MSIQAAETDHSPGDVSDTMRRALLEPMAVYADDPDAEASFEVAVYSEERQYVVNVDVDFCPCDDFHYRRRAEGDDCKHLKRAKLALGELDIPEWVTNTDVIDVTLRKRLDLD